MKKQGAFTTYFVLILGFLLLFTGCSSWQDDQYGEFLDNKYDKVVGYFTAKLDLDENQKGLLIKAADQLKDMEETFIGPPTIRDEMYDQFAGENIDKVKINTLIKEKVIAFDQKSTVIVDRLAAFQQSLSPEQRKKFVKILKKFDHKNRPYRWRMGL